MVDEAAAIIGGSVAGGIVFLLAIGFIVHLICSKRKHRKKKNDPTKFRNLSPHISPNHSQPSSLGQNGRLPKVNSTGLWLGTPSMYTSAAPSTAYYYGGQGKGPQQQGMMPPMGLISRASSETRIPGSVPVVGVQPRIFHSSQPLAPVFEVPASRGYNPDLDIYNFYQFDGSGKAQSQLVETRHSKFYFQDQGTKPGLNLVRSQSDVQNKSHLLNRSRGTSGRNDSHNSNNKSSLLSRGSKNSSSKNLPAQVPGQNPNVKQGKPPRHPVPGVHQSRQHSFNNEIQLVAGTPYYNFNSGNRKSKSVDSLGNRSNYSGQYNHAFTDVVGDGSARSSSLGGDIILRPAASPIVPTRVAVVPASKMNAAGVGEPNGDVISRIHNNTTSSSAAGSDMSSVMNSSPEIHPSATDSMKLMAKNKTDDQKTITTSAPSPNGVVVLSGNQSDKKIEEDSNIAVDDNVKDEGLQDSFVRYVYQGDIYSLPDKGKTTTTQQSSPAEVDDGNPLLTRMKEMVLEKTRTRNDIPLTPPSSPRYDVINVDSNQNRDAFHNKIVNNNNDISSTATTTINVSGSEYQEVKPTTTVNIISNSAPPPKPDVSDMKRVGSVEEAVEEDSSALKDVYSNIEESGASFKGTDETDGLSPPTSPVKLRDNGSDVIDNADDIGNAGKRITDSAFEFLNTYLSDEDGE